jgi:hypothetical protein
MKTKFLIIIAISLLSNSSYTQNNKCARVTNFGETEICLPKIEGFQECYLEPAVNSLANRTEVSSNMVLGYYLDDNTYKKKDSLEQIEFDNYFKIYGTKQIKDVKADSEILKQIEIMLSQNFISKNWDEMKKEIDDNGLNIEIDKPTIINSYNLGDESFTYILLAKYSFEGTKPYVMALSMNGLLLKDKLVWMAYYLNYEGEETIPELEKKSNLLISQILNANKKY